MFPTAAAQLLLGPASGLLHRVLSLRAHLIAGQLTCAAGFASLALWHDAPWQVYAATAVLGIGFWLCLVALPNQVVSAVPAARTGSATAVNTVVRNAGVPSASSWPRRSSCPPRRAAWPRRPRRATSAPRSCARRPPAPAPSWPAPSRAGRGASPPRHWEDGR